MHRATAGLVFFSFFFVNGTMKLINVNRRDNVWKHIETKTNQFCFISLLILTTLPAFFAPVTVLFINYESFNIL